MVNYAELTPLVVVYAFPLFYSCPLEMLAFLGPVSSTIKTLVDSTPRDMYVCPFLFYPDVVVLLFV